MSFSRIQTCYLPAMSMNRLAGFLRAGVVAGVVFVALISRGQGGSANGFERYEATDTLVLPTGAEAAVQTLYDQVGYAGETFDVRVFSAGAGGFATTDAAKLLRFASPHTFKTKAANTVTVEYFPPAPAPAPGGKVTGKSKTPAVLVLHSVFPRMSIGRAVARALAARGVHAFMMHGPGFGLRGIEGPRVGADFFRRQTVAVADARRARDAIAALPGVDAGRISILGVSLGGFVATHAAALDEAPVFANQFLILAGADLYTVISEGQRDAGHIRRALLVAGLDGEKLREACEPLDTALVGGRLDAANTYLFSARRDTVVPAKNAQGLADAIDFTEYPGHHFWLDADHYTAGLHMPWIVKQVGDVILRGE